MALSQQGKLELAIDVQGELLEGPIWDERIQRLHFVDINGQQIHTFDPDNNSQQLRYSVVAHSIWLDTTRLFIRCPCLGVYVHLINLSLNSACVLNQAYISQST